MTTTTFSPQEFLADQSFRMLIGGDLVARNGGPVTETLDPSTGAVLTAVPEASADDVRRAVEAAQRAQPGWQALGIAGRAACFARLGELLVEHRERLALLDAVDCGNPLRAMRIDVDICLQYLAAYPRDGLGPARPGDRRQPERPALHEEPPLRGDRAHPGVQPPDDVRRHPAAARPHHRQHRGDEAGPPDARCRDSRWASCSPRRSRPA